MSYLVLCCYLFMCKLLRNNYMYLGWERDNYFFCYYIDYSLFGEVFLFRLMLRIGFVIL